MYKRQIVGHPGESEADFEELCEFVKDFGFDRVSVFAYSKEEDTAAAFLSFNARKDRL